MPNGRVVRSYEVPVKIVVDLCNWACPSWKYQWAGVHHTRQKWLETEVSDKVPMQTLCSGSPSNAIWGTHRLEVPSRYHLARPRERHKGADGGNGYHFSAEG